MKALFSLLLLALAGSLLAQSTRPAAVRSAALRARIAALLGPRQEPVRLPADPPNPFASPPGAAVAPLSEREASPPAALEIPPTTDAVPDEAPASAPEVLARLAARLRITGIIRLKDQVHIIINDSAWKEGDSIVVERNPRVIQLQVARIQPGQVTLRLEDAEMVLRF